MELSPAKLRDGGSMQIGIPGENEIDVRYCPELSAPGEIS